MTDNSKTDNSLMFTDDLRFNNSARRWLIIGVWSLAIAGVFAVALVVSRTPGFCDMPFFMNLFRKALVVHVDLSVLVWFLSIACMFWSLAPHSVSNFPYLNRAAQICFVLGMAFISFSPFDRTSEGVMSNYIPVISSPLFFVGLSLLLCGIGLMAVRLFSASCIKNTSPAIKFAVYSSGVIAVFSIAAFIWSFYLLPPEIDGQQFYEIGFWGGGHVLQFVHIQIMLLCWLWLAISLKSDFFVSNTVLYSLFAIGLAVAVSTPLPYFLYDITSMEHREFFTNGMIIAGGIAPVLLSLFIIPVLWKERAARKGKNKALWASLLMSLLLFMYGGVLGGLIQGQNIVIPAHYHGSIVGITLAFMGAAYLLLPRFGYRDVAGWKLAFWQPLVYGFGQIMHISGLAYSGGYGGLQRKTPCGGGVELAADIKAAMGFMGLGGLLAIIGGIMFVVVVVRAAYGSRA